MGLGAPLLLAVVWGIFLAPRASVKVPGAAHLVLALVIFGLAAVALAVAGRLTLAWVFAALVVLNLTLQGIWHQ